MKTFLLACAVAIAVVSMPAQQMVTETRDAAQAQDEDFAKAVKEWTTGPEFISPLVDHLPKVPGIPSPKDVLGYHIGAPHTLTYYADIVRYYRALAAASPRVKVETIGRSDEDRELVVVWISSDENTRNLQKNRDNLARIADPRDLSAADVKTLIAGTKPHYHLMGGLHSGETGPSEMLMELAYRLATETSPLITQIRDNVIVSITPAADPDGRDRNVDWFYQTLERQRASGSAPAPATPGSGRGGPSLPYWGKYVYHDNNRDINLSQVSMRALVDWYFTAHPPIMHDLHEAQPLLYTYSGGPPQNPNLDPILFTELPFFSNFELEQMTKWGMPGVYTHAFMDGWSPGYLGSVAYNHNGMMRLYETQSGNDTVADRANAPAGARAEGARADGAGARGDAARGGGRAVVSTGRGASQPREWYRGLPVPPDAVTTFSRRNNTNYMETGVLSALQLTSMFPNLVVENFYRKTQNSIDAGRTQPPYGYVIPPERDMTRVATLVNILRAQRIEVGRSTAEIKTSDGTFPAGTYVIKRDQPYGRLAKNLLERQTYPDANLTTYDDSGWTMGLALMTEVKEIKDKAILDARVTPVETAVARGKVTAAGSVLAVAHYGSTNMVAFRYRLKDVPMKIAEKRFTANGLECPPGSFVVADTPRARDAVVDLGLTAAALPAAPDVAAHDADLPHIAIYSGWNATQEAGWVRFAFDTFGVPYDLIFKERLARGNLRSDYDVIVMPTQPATRQAIFAPPADRPVPYMKSEKYKFLGMYGEAPDITGGMGGAGVEAFAKFLDAGGTLITMGEASRFPSEFGFARTVDASGSTSSQFYAPRPIVNAEILKPEDPVFYGYPDKIIPVKYLGGPLISVASADQSTVVGRYVGGDASVLSGLMRGADEIREKPFALDVPGGYSGKGRVIMFATNPIYRWQNHGEFNMVFNALLNWNDKPAPPAKQATSSDVPQRTR
jgi:hypothetical protein